MYFRYFFQVSLLCFCTVLPNHQVSCCCYSPFSDHLPFCGLQTLNFFLPSLLTHFRDITVAITSLKPRLHHANAPGKQMVLGISNPESGYY